MDIYDEKLEQQIQGKTWQYTSKNWWWVVLIWSRSFTCIYIVNFPNALAEKILNLSFRPKGRDIREDFMIFDNSFKHNKGTLNTELNNTKTTCWGKIQKIWRIGWFGWWISRWNWCGFNNDDPSCGTNISQ